MACNSSILGHCIIQMGTLKYTMTIPIFYKNIDFYWWLVLLYGTKYSKRFVEKQNHWKLFRLEINFWMELKWGELDVLLRILMASLISFHYIVCCYLLVL